MFNIGMHFKKSENGLDGVVVGAAPPRPVSRVGQFFGAAPGGFFHDAAQYLRGEEKAAEAQKPEEKAKLLKKQ